MVNFILEKSASKFKNTYAVFGIICIVFFTGLSVFLYTVDSEMKISDAVTIAAFSLLGIPLIFINKFK
ncbi:MAG TPA: hypothetical protein DCS38_05145 [Ruminococcus sp.]|nr:hypothetical protein [Ruminococcus sp.]HBN10919.1 hypothetical protein [Ruminococcus sp.]HCR74798.1 hypothetical protein [Ruminococcus sp.]